jgi:hypothetical protein
LTARVFESQIWNKRDREPPTDRRLLSEEFAAALHTMGRARGHLSAPAPLRLG